MSARVSGQGWSRLALGFGAAFSVAGNVTHTVLVDSPVSLILRIPFAVAWPLALFIAVEVLVRVPWRRRLLDVLGRLVLILPVSAVAAVVSYQHLHQLMQLSGEDGFSSTIGPLAIDGLMMGGTVALLAIRFVLLMRTAETTEPDPNPIQIVETPFGVHSLGTTPQSAIDGYGLAEPATDTEIVEQLVNGAPRTPAVEQAVQELIKPRTARPAKATPEDMRKAVLALLDGKKVPEALELAGLPSSRRAALGRYNTVINRLRNNPSADVSDIPGIAPELLALIHDDANRRRPL